MKKHQSAMKKLEQASGQEFDKVFMQQLKLAQNAAKGSRSTSSRRSRSPHR